MQASYLQYICCTIRQLASHSLIEQAIGHFVLVCITLDYSVALCITLYYFVLLYSTLYYFILLCIIL